MDNCVALPSVSTTSILVCHTVNSCECVQQTDIFKNTSKRVDLLHHTNLINSALRNTIKNTISSSCHSGYVDVFPVKLVF